MLEHWQPGQSITLRGVWRQKLWFAGPARVVVDSPSLIALYWSAGMVSKIPRERATAQTFLNKNDPELVDHLWVETDVLALNVPGESNSIYVMWETGTKKLRCWYVNLEEPLQRTAIGFDTMDYELDIVINPDKSGWRWKDEESFEEMVRVGLFPRQKPRPSGPKACVPFTSSKPTNLPSATAGSIGRLPPPGPFRFSPPIGKC